MAEEGAILVPASVPFEVLATLGCAVVTGFGAVTNAARVERGAPACTRVYSRFIILVPWCLFPPNIPHGRDV